MRLTKRARQKVVVKSKQNEAILKRVKATVKNNSLEGYVKVQNTGRGVVVRVKGQLLFNSGSADLKKAAYPLLDEIIGIAEEYPYDMSVEGHTDSTPITSSKFPSNWELSTARAISTLRYIMDSGRISFERLGASGYAATRPIDSNDISEGRQNNRRVEFIFYQR
jgi:chemotaxis protein MotB